MSNITTIDLTCPRCGNQWAVTLAELMDPTSVAYKGVTYRGEEPTTRVESYSVRCPQCGNYRVVDVIYQEDDHG